MSLENLATFDSNIKDYPSFQGHRTKRPILKKAKLQTNVNRRLYEHELSEIPKRSFYFTTIEAEIMTAMQMKKMRDWVSRQTETGKIEPCPFCGESEGFRSSLEGDFVGLLLGPDDYVSVRVSCSTCLSKGPVVQFDDDRVNELLESGKEGFHLGKDGDSCAEAKGWAYYLAVKLWNERLGKH